MIAGALILEWIVVLLFIALFCIALSISCIAFVVFMAFKTEVSE